MVQKPAPLEHGCVSLIGYRCTGKTTVGRLLAKQLAWEFADSDEVVEQQAGKPIAEIFRDEGEEAFRQLEQDAIYQLTGCDKIVLSVGGGAVMREVNALRLQDVGVVIWLKAAASSIIDRLQADANTASQRPALTDRGVLEEVAHLLAERSSAYKQCAAHQIDTDDLTPGQVADRVYRLLTAEDGSRA